MADPRAIVSGEIGELTWPVHNPHTCACTERPQLQLQLQSEPRLLSPIRVYIRSHHCSHTRSHSHSLRIRWRCFAICHCCSDPLFTDNLQSRLLQSRSPSPIPAPIIIPLQPSQLLIVVVLPVSMSLPSPSPWYVGPPSVIWPTQIPKQPVDILTFHYNKNMAYMPAARTYDVHPLCVCM
jgi:hypothetical protein